MHPNKNTELVRVELQIPVSRYREMEMLRQRTGVSSDEELISNALSAFEWLVGECEDGRIVGSLDEKAGRYKEFVLEVLEKVASKAPQNKAFRSRG